jgi:hypothetical protein
MQSNSKLRGLMSMWPMHTALPSALLKERGFSGSLIQKYVSSQWLQSLTRGVFARPDDRVDWSGFVWGLQQCYPFHVGGKTALELQGKAHFVKLREHEIYLFSPRGYKFPSWLSRVAMQTQFITIQTQLIVPNSIGIKEYSFGEYSLKIADPARAFLEYMYLVDTYHSYEEAYYVMENLQFLSPKLMQEALERCCSIKVKRLVLCLAKKQNVRWYKDIDISRITLGKGVRQTVKNGFYDPEFLITYPKSWDKDREENVTFHELLLF